MHRVGLGLPIVALPLVASAAVVGGPTDQALVVVLPDQLDDCSAQLAQEYRLVNTYAAAHVTDLDGNGDISDADFLLWVKTDLANRLVLRDLDGNGFISADDEAGALAIALDKLSGDLNFDGSVTTLDTVTFLNHLANGDAATVSEHSADLDLDGAVTEADVLFQIAATNSGLTRDRVQDAVGLLVQISGSLTSQYYTLGHNKGITRQWPGHCESTSGHDNGGDRRRYPPNHQYESSQTWNVPDQHKKAVSESWPPMHIKSRSDGWEDEDHDRGLSRNWPPGHSHDRSAAWTPNPDFPHNTRISRRWPPDHVRDVSIAPGNPVHDERVSALYNDPDFPLTPDGWEPNDVVPSNPAHEPFWSASWGNHNQGLSEIFWPPNHAGATSSSWEGHSANTSQRWPSNHNGAISADWPADDNGLPPAWAPNHGKDLSADDGLPAQPPKPWLPPIFPEGHDISTTIQDWIPFIPSFN